jgi:hypothetical protein
MFRARVVSTCLAILSADRDTDSDNLPGGRMASRARNAIEHAHMCTVTLWDRDRFLGTGFFVAAQTVVTCAHVVRQAPKRITIGFAGRMIPSEVLLRDPEPRRHEGFYPFPDVAFVAVLEPLHHPVAYIDDEGLEKGRTIEVYGFSKSTPAQEPAETFASGVVAGITKTFIQLDDIRLRRGMSGSAAVDTARSSRSSTADHG